MVDILLFSPVDAEIIEPIDRICVGETEIAIADTIGGMYNTIEWTTNGMFADSVLSYEIHADNLNPGPNNEIYFYATDYCGHVDSVRMDVEIVDCVIEPPNVFTPNGDSFSGGPFGNNYFSRWRQV